MTDEREPSGNRCRTKGGSSTLLFDPREIGSELSDSLDVALDDPYFFDHPLDHVPGLALVAGLLDVARGGGGELEVDDRRVAVSFRFPGFCELDRPIGLQASGTLEAEVTFAARQGERLVCDGSVAHRPATRAGPGRPIANPALGRRADAELVHRARPENILISSMAAFDEFRVVAVLPPAQGHFLATPPGTPIRVETLVDAARQFGIMLFHLEHGKPMGTHFILAAIDAEWHCDLASPVYLRWAWTPPPRNRFDIGFDLVAALDGERCGRIDFTAMALSPAGYDRLRAACDTKATSA